MDAIMELVSALATFTIVGALARLMMLGISAMGDTDSVDKATYKRQARYVIVVLIIAIVVLSGSLPSMISHYFKV